MTVQNRQLLPSGRKGRGQEHQRVNAELNGLPGQCSSTSVFAALAWVPLWGIRCTAHAKQLVLPGQSLLGRSSWFLLPLLLQCQGFLLPPG